MYFKTYIICMKFSFPFFSVSVYGTSSSKKGLSFPPLKKGREASPPQFDSVMSFDDSKNLENTVAIAGTSLNCG